MYHLILVLLLAMLFYRCSFDYNQEHYKIKYPPKYEKNLLFENNR